MDINTVKSELESAGHILDTYIKRGFIKKSDIYYMLFKSSTEILGMDLRNLKTPSDRLLYSLYFKPFILYYSSYLDDDMIEILSDFIVQRYEEEKFELDQKYNNNEIKKTDYMEEIEKMKLYYFFSSPYGINIGRTLIDCDDASLTRN